MPDDRPKVVEIQKETNKLIIEARNSYYEKLRNLLSDSSGEKHFWSAFKKLSSKEKTTSISPIIDNNAHITDFNQKASIFIDNFATQCTIHNNGSVLPPLNFHNFPSSKLIQMKLLKLLVNRMLKKLMDVTKSPWLCLSYARRDFCSHKFDFPTLY